MPGSILKDLDSWTSLDFWKAWGHLGSILKAWGFKLKCWLFPSKLVKGPYVTHLTFSEHAYDIRVESIWLIALLLTISVDQALQLHCCVQPYLLCWDSTPSTMCPTKKPWVILEIGLLGRTSFKVTRRCKKVIIFSGDILPKDSRLISHHLE